jgi:hypothetical protein
VVVLDVGEVENGLGDEEGGGLRGDLVRWKKEARVKVEMWSREVMVETSEGRGDMEGRRKGSLGGGKRERRENAAYP